MILKFFSFLVILKLVTSAPSIHNSKDFIKEENYTGYVITSHGYDLEQHVVTTADGYILKIFRIPKPGKEIVFLQHGLLCSSADWVVIGPGTSLAYLLSDAGYDVWLGNFRGNTQSRNHQYLLPNRKAFWDFSWHEMGQFDLPAMIDHTLKVTGKSALHYVGHSQGTTAFFVMGSLHPAMNSKIKSMHALAPVAFASHIVSPFVRAIAPFINQIDWVMEMMGIYEFAPNNDMMVRGGKLLCDETSVFHEVCVNVLFLLGGYNSNQLNRQILPTILEHTPAGSSVNQLVHFAQLVNSGKFNMFDYGWFKNMARYGQRKPPEYDLSKVTAPIFLHYSGNDWMSAVKDVDELASKLPNLKGKFRVPDPKFNHLDYTYAKDVKTLLNDRIISFIRRY